jgi:hypothetical protein
MQLPQYYGGFLHVRPLFIMSGGQQKSASSIETIYTGSFTALPTGAGFFPATNNQALNALARARTVQISETRRKLFTNDSSIAFLSATCVSLLTLVGRVIAASLTRCTAIACCMPGERCRVARWLSRLLVKTDKTTIPMFQWGTTANDG